MFSFDSDPGRVYTKFCFMLDFVLQFIDSCLVFQHCGLVCFQADVDSPYIKSLLFSFRMSSKPKVLN